ncbi:MULTISPECIES: DUF6776 family protein [Marinobacter]|uniref:DUF6776 family protein n=1 Tax=Marinobacter TaxID=2742 RepID=UPI000DAED2F0|nr:MULTISPECIES: DUF6776 family protein [Marinobacter]
MSSERKKQGEYIVVRHQPGQKWRRFLVLMGCCALFAVIGYFAGMAQGGFRFSDVTKSDKDLTGELADLRQQRSGLQRQVVNLERGRKIDQQALTQARHTISRLEDRLVAVNSDLTFYKNIMAPSESAMGLQIQRFELEPRRGDERYRFKLVLTQVGENSSYIAGLVAVNVVGQRGGEREVIALRDLSDDIENLGIRFRYRYFQDVEGVMTLPEGFEPLEIQVVAKAEGRKATKSERTFDWQSLTEK